jgi:hypothetical protein
VSLVARHAEAAGIPTVVIGSARDIEKECGVPRFLFADFPLGNPIGKPWDTAMQRATTGMALDLLEQAFAPRTTVQTPFEWGSDGWRANYMRVDETNRAELAAAGEARRRLQREASARGIKRKD